ncbi:MAG: shikimate dehydrogenase [Clostridia bacterium]|nr:shikimate dehydrogenase [Clostridia bacterium]
MTYGLIGEKLGHSFSKEIHELLADYTYELKEIPSQDLQGFFEERAFEAINVTVPYKQTVMPFLDEISPKAQAIGAVNTVVKRDGKLYGYNTDILGMAALLDYHKIDIENKKVLILGSGGTAHTAYALAKERKASQVLIVSRSGKDGITYEEAYDAHTDAQIIINTTPCGMYPNMDASPLDLSTFDALEGVVDAIYNPLRTDLILQAKGKGINAAGGLYMLVAQAVYAVQFFLNCTIESSKIDEVYHKICSQKENIVLIGMPSCGKSTVGKRLAKQLNRPFYDTDELICGEYGKTPAEIIKSEGESVFRDCESSIISKAVAGINGAVIATGGGAILRDENVHQLKKNGKLFFIDRPLELLITSKDRPLSSDRAALEARYRERYPRYCAVADAIISPAVDLDAICNEIIKEMNR